MASIMTTAQKVRDAQKSNPAVTKKHLVSKGIIADRQVFVADPNRYANVIKRPTNKVSGPIHSSQLRDIGEDAKKRAAVAEAKKVLAASAPVAEEPKKRGRKPNVK